MLALCGLKAGCTGGSALESYLDEQAERGFSGAVAYGGATMFGFNATIVELPRKHALIVVLTNANVLPGFRADEVARGLEERLR